MAAMMDMSN